MEDKDIEDIIQKTLDESRKRRVAKVFRDPLSAESAFVWAIIGGFIACGLAFGMGMYAVDDLSDRNSDIRMNTVIPHLSCDDLKEIIGDKNIASATKEYFIKYAPLKCS